MKNRISLFIVSAIAVVVIASCSKGITTDDDGGGGVHNPQPSDTTAPVINISSPTAAQVYMNGNTINVSGTVSDDYGLYRGSIKITNDANGFSVKEQLYEIHGIVSYNFNINHAATVTTAADYTVTVSFEDHGYNVITKSVKIKVNP